MATLLQKSVTYPGNDNTYKFAVEAADFDVTASNSAGDYVIYEGELYRITADRAANTSWANTSKTKTNATTEIKRVEAKEDEAVGELKSALDNEATASKVQFAFDVDNWRTGYYKSTDGAYDTWSKAICSRYTFTSFADAFVVIAPSGAYIMVTEYDDTNAFVGLYGNFNPNRAVPLTSFVSVKNTAGHMFQFTVGFWEDSSAATHLTQSYLNQITLYNIYNAQTEYTNRLFQYVGDWKEGYYKKSDGTYDTWSRTICTKNPWIPGEACDVKIVCPSDAHVAVQEYDATGTYVKQIGQYNPNTGCPYSVILFKAIKGYSYNITLGLFAINEAASHLTQSYLDTLYVYTNCKNDMGYDIETTGDTTDRTAEIQWILSKNKVCHFGPGLFCTTGIIMPDDTKICGQGNGTEIRLLPTTNTELWVAGNQSFTQYADVTYSPVLPKGRYRFQADIVSSDTDSTVCSVSFFKASPYVAANRVGISEIKRGTNNVFEIFTTDDVVCIELYASNTYANSAGDTATYSNISLVKVDTAITLGSRCAVENVTITGDSDDITPPNENGYRHGIGYYLPASGVYPKGGMISNCWMKRFTGGALNLYNTGGAVDSGLNVSNCVMQNSYCGIQIEHISEFHRFGNCSTTRNHIGVINNGGNNQFTGCNVSGNVNGFVMDNAAQKHPNGTHGSCVGCVMQHNTGTTIYVNYGLSGWVFTGCNIDPDSASDTCINIVNSRLIIFNACNFMAYFNATITGVGLVNFNACNFRDDLTGKITHNAQTRFNACYMPDGTLVDPTA